MNTWSLPVGDSDSFFGVDSVDSKSSLSFECFSIQLLIEPAVSLEVILKYSIFIFYVGDHPRINLPPSLGLEVRHLYL